MTARHALLVLPIHLRSQEQYYADHDRFVLREKAKVAGNIGKAFEKLTPNLRKTHEAMWWWAPWRFNDIVGFLEVGVDTGDGMVGDLWLKRKHFPRHAQMTPSWHASGGALSNHEILSYCETRPEPMDPRNNGACAVACQKVIRQAEVILHRRSSLRKARVWTASFPLDHVDFVAAIRAAQGHDP